VIEEYPLNACVGVLGETGNGAIGRANDTVVLDVAAIGVEVARSRIQRLCSLELLQVLVLRWGNEEPRHERGDEGVRVAVRRRNAFTGTFEAFVDLLG
jgi:hypothetical protein